MTETSSDSLPLPSPSGVTVVRRSPHDGAERTFHLIGTAHVSRRSIDEVEEAIARIRPDTVCVELCPIRYAALTDDSRWRRLDVREIVRSGEAGFTLATLALQAFQKRLGDRLGVRPGAELLAATVAAKRVGAHVVLADRDVRITLRRTWANLGPVKRTVVLGALLASAFGDEEIDEQQIEALKKREHISDLMGQLAKTMPEVKGPLIDERDRYLIRQVEQSTGSTVVAVVGAGHLEGMIANLGQPIELDRLETIPLPSFAQRARRWAMPLVAMGALLTSLAAGAAGSAFLGWVASTSAATAGLIVILRGSVPAVLLGGLAAPVLAFLPGALSRVIGAVEVRVRPPRAEDGERLGSEVISMGSALQNRVTRTLLVATAAEAGGALGRGIGVGWLLWTMVRARMG